MIDTHIHLDDHKFNGLVQGIINDMPRDNLELLINVSCNYDSMVKSVQLTRAYDNVYCTIGTHPHDASTFDDNMVKAMREYAQLDKVVGVGEIGLDYYYDFSPISTQKDVFARQIEIADQLKLPICLHIRDAFGDCNDILTAERKYLNNGVLLHCYSGSGEQARQWAKQGYFFAFGGAITFKKNHKSEVLSVIPITQVLTETDAPYLTPEPYRGKLNLPRYISLVLPVMAQAYGVSVQDMDEQVKRNCYNFFGRLPRLNG